MLHQCPDDREVHLGVFLIVERVVEVPTIVNNRLVINMGRFVDKGLEFLDTTERILTEIVCDSSFPAAGQLQFVAVRADVGNLDHLIIIITHADEVLDVLRSPSQNFILLLIVLVVHSLENKFFRTDNLLPMPMKRGRTIQKELLLQTLHLLAYVHAREINIIIGVFRQILDDVRNLVTVVGRLQQVVNALGIARQLVCLYIGKVYLDVKINQQVARVDDSIVEYLRPSRQITTFFKILHGDVLAVAIIE